MYSCLRYSARVARSSLGHQGVNDDCAQHSLNRDGTPVFPRRGIVVFAGLDTPLEMAPVPHVVFLQPDTTPSIQTRHPRV